MDDESGRQSPSARTASDFKQNPHWVRKMKTAFSVLDTNHDNFITLEDIEAPLRDMTDKLNAPEEERQAILEQARRYWIDLVNGGTIPPTDHKVSECMFVENVARAVTTQPFEPKVKALGSTLLSLIDPKKRGHITGEDFLKIYSAHQVGDEEASQLFVKIGRVTKEDYVDAVLFFFTDLEGESDHRNQVFGPLRSETSTQ